MERLQKIIARTGLASRRKAERWIAEGKVTVNGEVVTSLGSRADPARDRIAIDGRLLPRSEQRCYFLFHKPSAVITSMDDPEGRSHLGEWMKVRGVPRGVFPVGRLDYYSSGLLLLTNDGELAHRLTHPRYEIAKVYHVKVEGRPAESELDKLRRGIRLEDGMAAPARVKCLRASKKKSWLEVEIHEGRYREVRRMFEELGYRVEKLARIRFGPLKLAALKPGEFRSLSALELDRLRAAVRLAKASGSAPSRSRRS